MSREERRRIAHELHDDLGQRLAFLHLKLSGLGESEPMLRPRLSDLVDQLAEVSTTTHELSTASIPGCSSLQVLRLRRNDCVRMSRVEHPCPFVRRWKIARAAPAQSFAVFISSDAGGVTQYRG